MLVVSGCVNFSAATGSAFSKPDRTYSPTLTITMVPSTDATSSPTPTAAPIATSMPAGAPVLIASDGTEMLQRKFVWTYKDMEWRYTANISRGIYDFYKAKQHDGTNNYANYALSDEDRSFLKDMAAQFKQVGDQYGYTEYEDAMVVATFVQSLPYKEDLASKGSVEYPRYPLETLIDNGGDCEDKVILASAILYEMGYGEAILKFPDHMAVGLALPGGVKLPENAPPHYFDYRDQRYYYMETSKETWNIGEMPEELESQVPVYFLMVKDPKVEMDFTAKLYDSDTDNIRYSIHCTVKNQGPGMARNIKVHGMALAPEKGLEKIWLPDLQFSLGDCAEGQTAEADGILTIPRDQVAQIKFILSGDNFEGSEKCTDSFNT